MILKDRRLVILQTESQAIHYYKNFFSRQSDIVLPIGPESLYFAEKHNFQIINLKDLWTEIEYENAKNESFFQLSKLVEELNRFSVKFDSNIKLEIGHYFEFQLWVVISQIRLNHFIVQSIFKNINPSNILCYRKSSNLLFMQYRPDPDCILVDVLLNFKPNSNIKVEVHKMEEKQIIKTRREKILSRIPSAIRIFLSKYRDNLLIKNEYKPSRKLLLVGSASEWSNLNKFEHFKKSFQLLRQPTITHSFWGECPSELKEIVESSISYNNFKIYDVSQLSKKIFFELNDFSQSFWRISSKVKDCNAIVTNVLTLPIDLYIAHVASLNSVPVVVWQHGEKGQSNDPTIESTELRYASNYFCYSESVKKYFQSIFYNKKLVNIDIVGSIEKRVKWSGGGGIVYATGKWFKTATPFLPLADPDYRLFNAHRKILTFLENLSSEYTIVFRPNNTPGFNNIPYKFNKVKIDYNSSFVKLLENASVIILDTPATTLVEACSTKVPIFVLGGRTNYLPDFLESIKKRVVWCEDANDLCEKLDKFIKFKIYESDLNDETYLKKYCPKEDNLIVLNNIINSLFSATNKNQL
jgi:hypothetical protein